MALDGVGLVSLDDLHGPYAWSKRHLDEALEALRLELEPGSRCDPDPPPVVVALCRTIQPEQVPRHARWLSRARSVVLVWDWREEALDPPDPEVLALMAEEQAQAAAALGNLAAILHLRDDPAPLREALQIAASLPADRPPDPRLRPRRRAAFPPGPWLERPAFSGCRGEAPARLAAALCVREGRPTLVDLPRGLWIDLLSGEEGPGIQLDCTSWAVDAEGAFALVPAAGAERGSRAVLDLRTGEQTPLPAEYGWPIGYDPLGRYAWWGHRCTFRWLRGDGLDVGPLAGCDHGWPCGHEKKQYGYLDNEPRWIHVAPDLSAYLSVYDKDAIVAAHVPVRWRRAGGLWVAHHRVEEDPLRALFFVRDEGEGGFPGDPLDANDDDARDRVPAIALGPDEGARYALDLNDAVYRIRGETSVRVGGPGEGYAVFDAQHRAVRRGEGRLLAGWHEWLTVQDEGWFWREETRSGRREPIAEVDREPQWAVALAGTPNAVIAREEGEKLHLRLV